MEISRALPEVVAPVLTGEPVTPPAWRVRIRMDDHPGTLARIAIRLADLECNILGLTVLPVPGGVLDEIVLRPAARLTRRDLTEAIRGEGCECTAIADADVHELVDTASATLTGARRAVDDPTRFAEVVRDVLAADVVTFVPPAEANPSRTESGHRAVFELGDGTAMVVRRHWAPFVQLELTRAKALIDLLAAVRLNLAGPVVLDRSDGAAVVLRTGVPADADAVSELHRRCSMATLFRRYHGAYALPAGGESLRMVPRRRLHRLLMPPRGTSVLAVCGREAIGLGQLIPRSDGGAEVSLLVEDNWQRQGIGSALLARLGALAGADGITELSADCLPDDDAMIRTAARAGLRAERVSGERAALRLFLEA